MRYWGPRYWPTWAFLAWLRIVAALPWRVAIRLHELLGRVLWRMLPSRRRVVRRNLEICFPELHRTELDALCRRHFEHVGACIAEIAFAWFAPVDRMARLFRIEGEEHLEAALRRGKGAILFSGHFTPLEICVPTIKWVVPLFGFMFRSRNDELLNEVQSRRRRRAAHVSFPNTDVRAMLRLLRSNGVVLHATDQARSGTHGALLPFFGEPAMTSTATSRLARVSGARIVPLFFRRLADGSGYLLRFEAPLEDLPTNDPVRDTSRLTATLERFVRECPEQYLWIHRRFKGRPGGPQGPYGGKHGNPTAPSKVSRHSNILTLLTLLAVPLFIVFFDNYTFWSKIIRTTINDEHQPAILLSMFVLVFFTLTGVLALAVGPRVMKGVSALLLVVAATCGFFIDQYGIIIDASMIRNVAETEFREAAPLLTASFLTHLFFFGVLPSLLLAFAPLGRLGWKRNLCTRGAVVLLGAVATVGTLYANYATLSSFTQRNHSTRVFINPAYPIYSYIRFLLRADDRAPAQRVALDASIGSAFSDRSKHELLVFVLGETARADRFSINGYPRETNRYTRPYDVVSFGDVTSCGTSTAESVPCLFSQFDRTHFTHAAAATRESIFGTLGRLGVDVLWRDNSTGCKQVCDPEHFEQFATLEDPEYCDDTGCFDEILLRDLDSVVADASRDHFIVLHQRGSHGPAYATDTPARAKAFFPECKRPSLRDCEPETVDNAYDNTILYTDLFLSETIAFLRQQADRYDSAMIYVSDHGESLGENGLYLHGFPYAISPSEQTHVPMIFWATAGFYADRGLEISCLRAKSRQSWSHDSIFHTLLPLFDVETSSYERKLDIFAECRQDFGTRLTTAGTNVDKAPH